MTRKFCFIIIIFISDWGNLRVPRLWCINSPHPQDNCDVFLSYKIKVNSGSVRNKTITTFQKKLYTEIKRLRSEDLSYNDVSKYLNKVGWKTSRENKFYGTNVWTFEKRINNVIQLIESNDSVITDLKIVVYDSRNKGS